MTRQRPLRGPMKAILAVGTAVAIALSVVTLIVLQERRAEAKKVRWTQFELDRALRCARDLAEGRLQLDESWENEFFVVKGDGDTLVFEKHHEGLDLLRDGWGHPILLRNPGHVHERGWDLYSTGPNGADEERAGDDILVGE